MCCAVVGVFQVPGDALTNTLLFCVIGTSSPPVIYFHHAVLSDIKFGEVACLSVIKKFLPNAAIGSTRVTRNGDMAICIQIYINSSMYVSQIERNVILKKGVAS